MLEEVEDEEVAKRRAKRRLIRRVVLAICVLFTASGWIYTRYVMKKSGLGGACKYKIQCLPDAPTCLRHDVDSDGTCSKKCATDADCTGGASEMRCIEVETEEEDEHRVPIKAGFCIPLEALPSSKRVKDAGAGGAATAAAGLGAEGSWLDVTESPTQLEGVALVQQGKKEAVSYLVKGPLVRLESAGRGKRLIADTATLRVFTVDDDRKTFSATALAATPGDVKVVKTDRRDKVVDRECMIWQLDDKEACVVAGAAFVDPKWTTVPPWARELGVRTSFPMRVAGVLEVTKFDPRHVDASDFAIPKTYKNAAARR